MTTKKRTATKSVRDNDKQAERTLSSNATAMMQLNAAETPGKKPSRHSKPPQKRKADGGDPADAEALRTELAALIKKIIKPKYRAEIDSHFDSELMLVKGTTDKQIERFHELRSAAYLLHRGRGSIHVPGHGPQLPASIANYLNRIGAKQTGVRKAAIVDEDSGYPVHLASIKIEMDGTVKVRRGHSAPELSNIEPNDEEKAAIAKDAASLPKSIPAAKQALDKLMPEIKGKEHYIIWSREKKDHIICVQVRIDKDDGGKIYLMYSYFSDQNWYLSEPDGPLPFFKPAKQTATNSAIMIHEGAKAAAAAERIATDKNHRFHSLLSLYEHWGTLGGAHRVQDMDVSEIAKAMPKEIVIAPDNDAVGKNSVPVLSRHLPRDVETLWFNWDDHFPKSWDFADPVPEAFKRAASTLGDCFRHLCGLPTGQATWS